MTNYNSKDVYGNIGEITSSSDRISNYRQKIVPKNRSKGKLAKILIASVAIASAGIGAYKIADYVKNLPEYETVSDKRARLLRIANEQLMSVQSPSESDGLHRVIEDINKGVYD